MDDPTLSTIPSVQSEDSSIIWSVSGLRFAIELGKDCLSGQAQRKQATEQRALQLIPFSVGLAGILITLTYTGKLAPVGNNYVWLWAAAVALLVGVACALGTLTRHDWGYSGMEPKDALYRYAVEGGEHGLLKAVSDDYQRKIEMNKKELNRMFFLTVVANLCALLGLTYGAMMVVTSQQEKPPLSSSVPQHETAPQPAAPTAR